MISTNIRANESFIVAKVGQTAIPTSGTLNNTSTTNVNLADGQIGVVSDSIWGTVAMNAFVDATPTIAEAPVLAIYQGNGNSAAMATATATYPLWVRPYERTNAIDGRGEVRVTEQAWRVPTHSTTVVGDTHAAAGAVNVLSDTEYELAIAFRGRRVEEMYGSEQAASLRASIVTPNFTTLGYTTQQARSYILHNLAWNINRNSTQFAINSRFPNNYPVLALLVDTTGASGTNTAIGGGTPLATGDTVTVLTSGGVSKTITVTEAMATSIKNAAVAAAGVAIASVTWEIITIDTSAPTSAANIADAMIIIGLDDKLAFVDWIPQVKNRLTVGLTQGFNQATVRNNEYVQADEGQGDGRTLDLLYKATHGQRKYNLRHTMDPVTDFPSPIVTTSKYRVFNILHGAFQKPDIANTVYVPSREIICIPEYDSDGTTTNPYIATFKSVLNNWLGSTNNGAIVSMN